METFSFSKAYEMISDKLESWLSTAIKMLPNFLIAVVVVIAFWFIAKVVRKVSKNLLNKFSDNKSLINLTSTVLYVSTITVGTFMALSVLHLDKTVTSLLAGVGVVGLALGFAFQDIAANFVAGVLIATRKPFGVGDLIRSNDYLGHVQKMNLRASIIRTFQGQDVIIPNSEIFTKPLTNFAIYPKRRIDLSVGVSYADDLEIVRKIAVKAVEKLEVVEQDMGVSLFFTEFGGSSINFDIRFWVDEHEQSHFLEARSEAIIAIKKAFDKNDISIPYPIRTLDFGIKGGKMLSETMLNVAHEESNSSKNSINNQVNQN